MKRYNESYKVICINDFTNGGDVLFTKGKSYTSDDTPIIYDPNTLQPVYCCVVRDNYNMLYKFYKSKETESQLYDTLYFPDYFVDLEEYRESQIGKVLNED